MNIRQKRGTYVTCFVCSKRSSLLNSRKNTSPRRDQQSPTRLRPNPFFCLPVRPPPTQKKKEGTHTLSYLRIGIPYFSPTQYTSVQRLFLLPPFLIFYGSSRKARSSPSLPTSWRSSSPFSEEKRSDDSFTIQSLPLLASSFYAASSSSSSPVCTLILLLPFLTPRRMAAKGETKGRKSSRWLLQHFFEKSSKDKFFCLFFLYFCHNSQLFLQQ